MLAVGTAWPTGMVPVIPPLLHGYADAIVTVALILLILTGTSAGGESLLETSIRGVFAAGDVR